MTSGIGILHPHSSASNFVATNVDPNYPATNLQDDHPKNVCRATGDEMEISFTVAIGATGIGATNIDGTTVTLEEVLAGSVVIGTGTGAGAITLGTGAGVVTLPPEPESGTVFIYDVNEFGTLWSEFDALTVAKTFKISIKGAVDYAEIGLIKAGAIDTVRQGLPSMQEGSIDLSSVRRLNSGALHITDRDVLRTVNFDFHAVRDDDFWDFMLTFRRRLKSNACFWRLNRGSDKMEWILFAKFAGGATGGPKGSTVSPTYTKIDAGLEEVL